MAEKKVQVKVGERMVEGVDVPIEETIERWTDVKLKDGSHLRVKMTVISVVRVDSVVDPQGNPTFSINMTPAMAVVDVPRKGQKGN